MTYSVKLSARARRELQSITDYLAQRNQSAADRWNRGIVLAMRSLADQPQRFALAMESDAFPFQIHQLLYGRKRNYRVVYTIQGNAVVVLTIRHAAQDNLDPSEF